MSKLIIFCDGGARGNPGPGGIGVVFKNETGKTLHSISKFIGHSTNNQAEYKALIEGLRHIAERKEKKLFDSISVFLDSELLVRQLTGKYRVKDKDLIPLFAEVQSFILRLALPIEFNHIRREQNKEADSLVNKALD